MQKIVTCILILAGLVGCTNKGKPHVLHEPAKASGPTNSPAQEATSPSPQAQQWLRVMENKKNPTAEILLPMAQRVLDPKRVIDNSLGDSRAVYDELVTFNELVLRVPQAQRKTPEFIQVLTMFKAAMQAECGSFEDSCRGRNYLRRAYNSVDVAKLVIEQFPQERFQLILMALKIRINGWDQQLVDLINQSLRQNLKSQELKAYSTIRTMMLNAIQSTENLSLDPVKTRRSLDQMQAWDMIRESEYSSDTNYKLDSASLQSLLRMIARARYMYSEDGKIHPGFQKLIDAETAKPGNIIATSAQTLARSGLKATAVGVEEIKSFNDMNFLIDLVFQSRLNPVSAGELILASGRAADLVAATLENYYRLQYFIYYQRAVAVLKKTMNGKLEGQSFLEYVLDNSDQVVKILGELNAKIDFLRTFSKAAFVNHPETLEKIEQFLNSTDKTTLYALTYPQMLLITKKLWHSDGYVTLYPYAYVAKTLLMKVVAGQFYPFLQYTAAREKLNTFDFMYAFDYGLRLGLFPALEPDLDSFLREVLEEISGKEVNYINKVFSAIQRRQKESSLSQSFKSICGELKSNRPVPRSLYLSDLVRQSPYYGTELHDNMFKDISSAGSESNNAEGKLDNENMGLNPIDYNFVEALERTRLDLGTHLRIGNAMLASLKSFYKSNGKSDIEIEKLTLKSQDFINSIIAKREDIFKRATNIWSEQGNCLWLAGKKDLQIKQQLLEAEIAHLRQIHRQMTELRRNPDPKLQEAYQAKLKYSGLPDGYQGRDQISSEAYLMTKVDFLLRLKTYFQSGITTEETTIGPIAPHLHIDVGQSFGHRTQLIMTNKYSSTPYTPDVNAFVANALSIELKVSGGNPSQFGSWYPVQNHANIVTARESSIVVLHRLERELYGFNTEFPIDKLWREHDFVMDTFRMSPFEKSLLTTISVPEMFGVLFLENRFGERSPTALVLISTWGLYDWPIKLAIRDELGKSYLLSIKSSSTPPEVLVRESLYNGGKEFYRARSDQLRPTLVFKQNPQVDKSLDASMRKFIRTEIQAIDDSIHSGRAYAKSKGELPPEERPYIDMDVENSIRSPMLKDEVINQYLAGIVDFHVKTNQCYKSEQACESFK